MRAHCLKKKTEEVVYPWSESLIQFILKLQRWKAPQKVAIFSRTLKRNGAELFNFEIIQALHIELAQSYSFPHPSGPTRRNGCLLSCWSQGENKSRPRLMSAVWITGKKPEGDRKSSTRKESGTLQKESGQ